MKRLRVQAFAVGSSQRVELAPGDLMPAAAETVEVEDAAGEVRRGVVWLQQFRPARVVAVRFEEAPADAVA